MFSNILMPMMFELIRQIHEMQFALCNDYFTTLSRLFLKLNSMFKE